MKQLRAGSRSLTRGLLMAIAFALVASFATPAFAVPVINGFSPSANPANENTAIDLVATASEDDTVNYTLSEFDFYRVDNGVPVLLGAVASAGPTVVFPTTLPEVGHAGALVTYQLIVKDAPFNPANPPQQAGPASFQETVVNVNHAPVANNGSFSTNENTAITITMTATDADPEDTLTYSIVSQPPINQGTLGAVTGNTVVFTPATGFVGTASFTFQATDDATPPAASNVASVSISVINRPPVASAGPDRTTPAGVPITLTGTYSDPDGDIVGTIGWVQISGPRVIALQNANTLSPTFPAPAPVSAQEVYGYRLNVTDSHGAPATSSMTITVTNGLPPQGNAGADDFATEGTSVTLQGSANDPDNQLPLTFQWTQIGGPLVTLSNPTILQPTFLAPHVSTETLLTFRLKVTDAGGNFVQDDVTWHVLQVGQALPQNPLLHDLIVFPSPFSAHRGATIRYSLRTASDVKITIVDVFGHVVRELESSSGGTGGVSGQNNVPWDGRNGDGNFVGNGLYIVQVRADGAGGHAKMNERVGVRN